MKRLFIGIGIAIVAFAFLLMRSFRLAVGVIALIAVFRWCKNFFK